MGISKITRNYQVTVPQDVRELKGLDIGDKVLFVIEGERVDLVKMDKKVISDAAGLWSDLKETGLQYEKRLRKGWRKRTA
ncbi:AbrB/MazE/SpoVT family DNA-binding domain-containing protein [Candidatus Woesearchaeota archaeon]|nr:AbrB/MazE/SpoVT family DNA-binding domain-containing protein [Candidatus Woesearchaeota archaeon]